MPIAHDILQKNAQLRKGDVLEQNMFAIETSAQQVSEEHIDQRRVVVLDIGVPPEPQGAHLHFHVC